MTTFLWICINVLEVNLSSDLHLKFGVTFVNLLPQTALLGLG